MLKRLAVASLLAVLVSSSAAALQTQDILGLIAMPLAVAAVSELTDVPTNDLIDVVTLLNNASVPPAQFVEVIRYVPVALVTQDPSADFVNFVRTQEAQGVRGTQLVTTIEQRITSLGVPVDLDVVAPRVVEVDQREFVPEIVRTRIAEVKVKSHPHGGPPGQLKKIAGVQTGAEIVHGVKPGHTRVITTRRGPKQHRIDNDDRVIIQQPRVVQPRVIRPVDIDRGHGHGEGHGNKGGGGGNGGGKGKGKKG